MEKKGLSISNAALTLARPDTATDSDRQRIKGVIVHSCFHNWMGSHLTCRNWFQLPLKKV